LNYGVIPWSHSYGFSNLITPLLCRGVPLVATEDRLPRAIVNGLESSGATVFPGVPVFYQKLAELSGTRPGKLRLCISAGAPLAETTATAFRREFGRKVHGFYGSSECGGIAFDRTEDEVPEGCVGEPMDGVELQHNEHTGRISVSSAAVGIDYYPQPDREVLRQGTFTPGDLLRHTPQGYVIAGRVSDFINIAGRKLNPVEVEQTLREVAGVEEALVFGIPHPTRGEEPIACVVGSATTETLQAYCSANLAPWQVPRDFWRVPGIPVSERGKCSRRAISELYLSGVRAVKQ
jgi:long-chain acyl-CoA synthetase